MATSTPRIAILGGGIAGGTLTVALKAARVPVDITVVDRNFEYEPPGSVLDVLYGLKKPDAVSFPTLPLYQKLGVQTLKAEVLRVDGDKRSVYTAARTFTTEYLIIALGSEPDPRPFEGATSLPAPVSSKEAATLANQIQSSTADDFLIISPETDSCLNFFPLEVAFAVRYLVSRRRKQPQARVRIVSPEPRPFSRWTPNFSEIISSELAKHHIEWIGDSAPASVKGGILTTRLGAEIPFQFAILVPPVRPPRVFQNSPMLDASGFVQANPFLFNSRGDKVYALGGCAGYVLPSTPQNEPPLLLPKWSQNAYDQAVILADNLVKEWKRDIKLSRYSGSAETGFRIGPSSYAKVSGTFFSPDTPRISIKFPGLLPTARAPSVPDLRKILS